MFFSCRGKCYICLITTARSKEEAVQKGFRVMDFSIGIDPGWSSCGLSLVSGKELVWSGSFVPKDSKSILGAIQTMEYKLNLCEKDANFDIEVYLERFVAYQGIHSSASEEILMFIGALVYYFQERGDTVNLVRAIEWKPKIAKHIFRTKGISNPSDSFDKKFSIWAAKQLSSKDIRSDHEADAICLSYLGAIK